MSSCNSLPLNEKRAKAQLQKNTWLLLISTVFVTDFICGFKTATHELFFASSWNFLPMKAAGVCTTLRVRGGFLPSVKRFWGEFGSCWRWIFIILLKNQGLRRMIGYSWRCSYNFIVLHESKLQTMYVVLVGTASDILYFPIKLVSLKSSNSGTWIENNISLVWAWLILDHNLPCCKLGMPYVFRHMFGSLL